jgi:hypothetical protein
MIYHYSWACMMNIAESYLPISHCLARGRRFGTFFERDPLPACREELLQQMWSEATAEHWPGTEELA